MYHIESIELLLKHCLFYERVVRGQFSKNCKNWSPPLLSFFELNEQDMSQKNTFFMHNSDSLKAFIVLP